MTMKPVTAITVVPAPLEELFELLQTSGTHELFTDHVLVGTGPVEIVEVDAHNWKIVERAAGSAERQTTAEYALFPLAEDLTEVQLTLRFDRVPAREKAVGPLVRSLLHRANQQSLDRLAARHLPTGAHA